MRSKFVAIEGPDGCGKSTIIAKLKKHFFEKKIEVRFTREPGGTKIGEKIRHILLDPKNAEMTDYTEAYLYAASRLQHVSEVILPSLESGVPVISDRFAMASIVYQGFGREKDAKLIEHINDLAVDMIGEVNYIVLMISPEEGLIRKKGQKALDRLEMESLSFHRRVYEGYSKMIREMNAIEVDASCSVEETFESVLDALRKIGVGVD